MCRFLRRVASRAVAVSRGLALQKRQGTKSRDVGLRRCDERYGDLSRARVSGSKLSAVSGRTRWPFRTWRAVVSSYGTTV